MMKTCLEESIVYAQERKTFGKPLIKHQVIRHKIADMSAKIDQIESYMHMMCWQINEGTMPVAEICKGKFAATNGGQAHIQRTGKRCDGFHCADR